MYSVTTPLTLKKFALRCIFETSKGGEKFSYLNTLIRSLAELVMIDLIHLVTLASFN